MRGRWGSGSLVARDDEHADRTRLRAFVVAARGPRVGDAAAVRRLGEIEGAAPVAAGEPELLGETRDSRTAVAAGTRPDQDDALCVADRINRVEDLRAVPPRRLDPEIDDGSELDDRHVAEDDDRVGVANRRERKSEAVERAGDFLWKHRLVRVEAGAQELAERVRVLDRL